MAEIQSERPLPDGWAQATIGEIAEQINSGFPSGKHNTEGIGVPHLRPMNISPNGEIDLSLVKYVEVSDYDALQEGDVLFNNTNSPAWLGKTAYIKKDTNWAYSNHMTRVRLHPEFDSSWVAYALHHLFLIGFFRMNCRHHVNQASINTNFLSTQTAIPIPPLAEQRRIVAEIETQFTRLDAAVVGLERAQANIRRYKAAVLKAACEGRLVPIEAELARAEGHDYEPAGQLLARILAERCAKWEAENPGKKYKVPAPPDTESLPELPKGWVWTNLDQIKAFSLYGPRFSSKDYSEHGKLVLRTSDISESGKVNLDTPPRLPLDAEQFAKYKCQIGDLLITRTGSLGTLAVFNDDVEAIPGAYLIQYRLAAPLVTSWYVFYLFKSPSGQKYLVKGGAGVGRPNLNAPTIEEFAVPLPPLAEQRRIVAEVERRLSLVEALEASVEAALARAGRLRQAVLKQAFEGRLVPQDPNDEPASVLLGRIRAEKAQREAEGKRTGGTKKPKAEDPQQLRMF